MFTQPVGNFPAYTTTVRPTANTVSSGSVTNAANAYDSDPSTYASFTTADWTMQTVPGGVIGSPTMYVSLDASGEYLGGPASPKPTYVLSMSTDGGTTYPYVFLSETGSYNHTGETVSVYIAGAVNLANIKFKVTCTNTNPSYIVSNKIYDVRVVY